MLIKADCLKALRSMSDESVDLIYLDPPFFTQQKQTLKTRDNSKAYYFKDTWENAERYINYIRNRLVECQRVLKNTGSIFLHCDRTASHQLRLMLDDVFDERNFQSEIVWVYKRWSNSKRGLLNSHQTIYFYSKSGDFKFNRTYDAYSPTTNVDQIFQKRVRDKNGKTKYKKDANGRCELIAQKKGVPLSDVWEIPYLNPKANERVGYPTQKPIILLERIIQLVTDAGDVVLDPFCGSGTALVAAALLGREYIGIDISSDAIELAKKRLANPVRSDSALLKKGRDAYINKDERILGMLQEIDAIPVQRNNGIDGFLKIDKAVRPIPLRIQRELETLETAMDLLMKATKKNGFKIAVLIKTNNRQETMLFDLPKVWNDRLFIIDNITMIPNLKGKLAMIV
jgi:site-specific DNA-methyltransferase (adenine-specific)